MSKRQASPAKAPAEKKSKEEAPPSGGVIRVTYWAGRGRVEPLRCIIAAGGDTCENVFLQDKAEMAALIATGKLTYDQVPLVEADGLCLSQGFPTALYLGSKYTLWPVEPASQYVVGHVCAAVADARSPLLSFPFHLDTAKALEACEAPKGLLGRYAPKWAALLEKACGHTDGAVFFLGSQASIADVMVFEVMDFFKDVFGQTQWEAAFSPYPRLLAMYKGALQLGRLQQWCQEERPKAFLPWGEYAKSVQTTLH